MERRAIVDSRHPRTAYKEPVPLYVPALSAALVLAFLFIVGLAEQRRLATQNVEQIVAKHEAMARLVANEIAQDLSRTEASSKRFAKEVERQLEPKDASAADQFEHWFEALPDGSTRSRASDFDADLDAAVWIPRYLHLEPREREFFVRIRELTQTYGRGAHGQVFMDTWIMPAAGGISIYWPTRPEYAFQIGADFDYRATEWVNPTRPELNPRKKSYWTKLIYDPVPKLWMLSAVAPLYWRGDWVGAVGHDVPLPTLLARTDLLRQAQDSAFVLLTEDGRVAASDRFADAIKGVAGNLYLQQLPETLWREAYEHADPNQIKKIGFTRVTLPNHIAFIARIGSQNWTLINLIPLQPIIAGIDTSFARLRNLAVLALIFELLIATAVLAWSQHRTRSHIAELTSKERALRTSEQQYRNLVTNIPGIVYRCTNDEHWTVQFISAATQEITGYPPDDFIGNRVRSFASVIHPDDRSALDTDVQQAIAAKGSYRLDYRIVRANAEVRWVREYGQPVFDGEKLLALEGVVLDNQALKQAETHLRTLNETLEQQVAAQTRELRAAVHDLESFNTAVSHDLRAPLRHLSSYLEILGEELANGNQEEIGVLMERCQRSLRRMDEMTMGMLHLAQLGRAALSQNTIGLGALVQEVADEQQHDYPRAAVHIEPLPDVVGDSMLLRQVFQNLIGNALKFSSARPQPTVQVRSRVDLAAGTEVVIEIRDNGAGFDSRYAGKLFTLFQRLHSDKEFAGTGVGLVVCEKIVSMHNGRIWTEGEVDKGAAFFVALPVSLAIIDLG